MPAFVILYYVFSCAVSGLVGLATAGSLQTPIKNANVENVRTLLKEAEIIPTVIDDFHPSIAIEVSWKNEDAQLGNTISPDELQQAPSISLLFDNGLLVPASESTTSNLVLTLTDPDAPSRNDPKWSEMCHWIAANLTLESDASVTEKGHRAKADELIPYKPPGPPPKTGKHRYVFLAFAPANGTSSPLTLTTPSERQHWGTGKKEHGVRDWAQENELVPIGANFIYSQNAKQ